MIAKCRLTKRAAVAAGAAMFACFAAPAFAQAPAGSPPAANAPQQNEQQQIRDEVDRLRKEFEAIRDSYGARLAALEARLGTGAPAAATTTPVPPVAALPEGAPAAAAAAAAAPGAAPSAQPQQPVATEAAAPPQQPSPGAEVPSGAAGAGGPQGSLPVYGSASASSKVFNPDMAVIGNFIGTTGENTVESAPSLEMHEAEVTFQAVVDPYARADVFLSASPDGLEIEEGFLTLTSLPGGLLAKVGKMKEQFGKANTMHPHTLPWVDVPIVMKNFLGGEEGLNDSGISVSRLLMNPLFFLEATGEVYQGNSGPFATHERSDVSWLGRLRGYRDISESSNLDVGFSFTHGHNDAGPDFTTRLFGVDATFRYRPLRRAIYRRFMARTELMWSNRGQETGDVDAFGMYASGDYQFARRWFAGVRFDYSERPTDANLVDKGPSVVLTYWPSEFSQIRGQYRRTNYAEGVTSNEALFQFLFSIGAHGAHTF